MEKNLDETIHANCNISKGIKYCECKYCGNPSVNYDNGIEVCVFCSVEKKICRICGKELIYEG